MSEAKKFVDERKKALNSRPKIELQKPHSDGKCLFRVGKDGSMEYHHTDKFSVNGEEQGETYPQMQLSAADALQLADWIMRTFK